MTKKKTMKKPAGLVFLGGGFLPGVPARDLSAEEVKARGLDVQVLIDCGLYGLATEEAAVAPEDKKEGE